MKLLFVFPSASFFSVKIKICSLFRLPPRHSLTSHLPQPSTFSYTNTGNLPPTSLEVHIHPIRNPQSVPSRKATRSKSEIQNPKFLTTPLPIPYNTRSVVGRPLLGAGGIGGAIGPGFRSQCPLSPEAGLHGFCVAQLVENEQVA